LAHPLDQDQLVAEAWGQLAWPITAVSAGRYNT